VISCTGAPTDWTGAHAPGRFSHDWLRVLTFAALARVLSVSMETLLYGEEEAARIAEERERAGGDDSTRRA
jgi:hypothetical protein